MSYTFFGYSFAVLIDFTMLQPALTRHVVWSLRIVYVWECPTNLGCRSPAILKDVRGRQLIWTVWKKPRANGQWTSKHAIFEYIVQKATALSNEQHVFYLIFAPMDFVLGLCYSTSAPCMENAQKSFQKVQY